MGLPVKEIARYFHREPRTVSLGVRKIEDLMGRGREMTERVEAIGKEMRKGRKRKYLITIA